MELQDKIEQFLNKKMAEREEQAFLLEMEENEDLAQKVAYNKGLMEFFDKREPKLESTLKGFGDKYFVAERKKPGIKKWLFILPSLLLLSFIIIYYIIPEKNSTTDSTNSNTIITSPKKDSVKDKSDIIQPTVSPSKPSDNPADTKQPDTEQPNQTQKEDNQPIAKLNPADFRPNLMLESLINESVRKDSPTVITEPIKGKLFEYASTINLKLQGSSAISPPYQVIIYSNKPSDFDNDIRVFDKTLDKLAFNANMSFSKGLYYLIIQDKANEEIIYVSKFVVR